jgi:hypothetical protein
MFLHELFDMVMKHEDIPEEYLKYEVLHESLLVNRGDIPSRIPQTENYVLSQPRRDVLIQFLWG